MQDNIKKKLWEIVDDNQEELFQICADLIKIPSVTRNQMDSIVEHVESFLEINNIEYERVLGPDKSPNIVAKVGQGLPYGIMNGHNDVVPVGEVKRWDFSPYAGTITASHIQGRGASDMKCGVGIMLFIAKKIKELALPIKGSIHLHIVHDEEIGGENGSKYLVEEGYADDALFALVPEPTTYTNVEVGQKGSMRANIKTYGIPFNSSVINYMGANAAHRMIAILNNMQNISNLKVDFPDQEVLDNSERIIKELVNKEGCEKAISHVNFQLRDIHGGGQTTMIPEVCQAQIGLLVPAYMKTRDVADKLVELAREVCPEDGFEIEFTRLIDGGVTEADTDLVKSALKHGSELWGEKVVPAHQWATSDTKYYRHKGIPAIQYGPAIIEGIHAYNEQVEKKEVSHVAKVYLAIINDLIGFGEVDD